MANLIRQQKLVDSNKRALVKYVLISDGTQNANTVLLDVSTLNFAMNANNQIMVAGADPKPTYRTTIKRIFGSVASSAGTIRIKWHGDANSEIIAVGDGGFDYDFQSMGDGATISNPEANSLGDILITTVGLAANDVATIFIDVRKNGEDYDSGQTADPYAFNNISRM